MQSLRKILALALSAGFLAITASGPALAESSVKGSGKAKTEKRDVGNFNSIEARGAMDVLVKQGGGPTVEITADDNILPLIKASVTGNTLKLETTKSVSTKVGIKAVIAVPSLNAVTLEGSHTVNLGSLAGDSLKLRMEGANTVKAQGAVKSLEVKMEGAGELAAGDLAADQVKVEVEGAGSARVNAKSTLDAKLSGAASVTYKGNPKVTKSISGVGSLDRG